jgi:hypothetical protein
MIATGIDPGGSACLAVVALDPVRLIALYDVHGVKWYDRMVAAVAGAQGPIYCERPATKIRKGSPMRNHNSAFGLGRNVGRWEAVAASQGRAILLVETGAWWAALPTKLTGKRGDGLHRVDEAAGMVRGCRAWLEAVPVSRRVDTAEAVMIAYAGCLLGR